jgi:hypothetical protein
MDKYYSGIGSRSTPSTIQRIMMFLARDLERDGYILRSGNAYSADEAFAKGVAKYAQIWLPWNDYNLEYQEERPSHEYRTISDDDKEAFESVNQFHPNGPNLREPVKRLMARNFRILIGYGEPDSQFIVCWTPEGGEVGGTAQAIRIAKHHHIPVFNLYSMSKSEVLKEIEKLNLLQ